MFPNITVRGGGKQNKKIQKQKQRNKHDLFIQTLKLTWWLVLNKKTLILFLYVCNLQFGSYPTLIWCGNYILTLVIKLSIVYNSLTLTLIHVLLDHLLSLNVVVLQPCNCIIVFLFTFIVNFKVTKSGDPLKFFEGIIVFASPNNLRKWLKIHGEGKSNFSIMDSGILKEGNTIVVRGAETSMST